MSSSAPLQVRLVPSFAVRVAVIAVGALVLLLVLVRSRTVLHWMITAAATAMLLDGPVRALVNRRVPRAVAVLVVTLSTLLGAALLTYGVIDALVEQYAILRETGPAAVADLVRSGPLSSFDARFDLVGRSADLVAQAPERLFGSPASAARTAAERLGEVALVITLTVFMLISYQGFQQRLQSLNAAGHPWRWMGIDEGLALGATGARHIIVRAVGLGVLTALVAQVAEVPAPALLGLWMAWWRLLPLLGLVIGHAPLVVLLLTGRSQLVAVLAVLVLVAGDAVARVVDLRTRRSSPHQVPMAFLSTVAFTAGFEFGGVTGAVVVLVLAHLAVGVVQQATAPSDSSAAQPGATGQLP